MRRVSWVLLLALSLLLGGCWSRLEVNDIAVALALAVDQGDEMPIRLTLYVPRGGGGEGGGGGGGGGGPTGPQQTPVWLASREGLNLSDALREIAQASPRRISMHHLRVALISEEVAQEGIEDFMDFLVRNPEVRLTVRVMAVKGYRAAEVLTIEPTLETLMSEQIAEVLPSKGGVLQRLKEIAVAHISTTHSPWMEQISLIDRPVRRADAPGEEVYYSGTALFKGGKMVEQLDRRETRALNWLLGKPTMAVISSPCPDNPEESFSAEIIHGDSRIRPYLAGNKVAFRVEIHGGVDVVRKPCTALFLDQKVLAEYEETLNKDLGERITGAIAKLQAKQVDPAGFGKRVQLAFPGYWQRIEKRWPEIWQESRVEVHTDIKISYSGVLIQPPVYTPGQPD